MSLPERDREKLRVHPHLTELIQGALETPHARQVTEQRDVNEVVHRMLIVGLVLSTCLMLLGLALDVLLQRIPPTTVPALGEVLGRIAALRPSGFLAAGLLVLIATPVLRVIGSVLAFAYERDWVYTGITLLVLLIVTVSVLLGR
jgi:uncharacterized membrane protein